MDFRLKDDETRTWPALPGMLNAAMPEGIRVTEVYETERKVRELRYLRVKGVLEYGPGRLRGDGRTVEEFYADR
jgi:hypothetical protein